MNSTWNGKQFLDTHLESIAAGKLDEMVDRDYAKNAILITFFPGLKVPPPIIAKGREEIKEFFHQYMNVIGTIDVQSLDLAETEDTIFLQSKFQCNLGLVQTGVAWTIQEEKIAHHFGFWV